LAIHNLLKDQKLNQYIKEISLQEPELLKELREKTSSHPCAKMQIPPEEGQLLSLFINLLKVKKALEIGVFTGYSSLSIALALPENGKLYALDCNAEWAKQANIFWTKAGVNSKIELLIDDALNSLKKLIKTGHRNSFDFAFIDADKKNYENYYELTLELLKSGGLLIIDNILWRGYVADSNKNDKPTETIRNFNLKLKNDRRIKQSLLPLWDGISLILKL